MIVGVVLALTGCKVDVAVPGASSVHEIKSRTLERIDRFEKALRENRVRADDVKGLAASINFLRGHMLSTGVGTEEQHRALDEVLYRLAVAGGDAGAPPPDWTPSGGKAAAPKPVIEPGPIRELLPQIRRIVEAVPDSDLRP